MGGSTGTSTVGGSMGSSAPKGGGQSSAPSSYLPTAPGTGGAGALTPSSYYQQPSYGPPPSSYYQPQSQQSYNMGGGKGTSQPAYGGGYSNPFASQQFSNTGYNTPRLPQMIQPQYGNYNFNPTINRAPPGTVYSGPSSTVYPSAPAPIPGNVYSGPTPTPTSTIMAAPPPEDFTAAPTINRAPIVEAPPAPTPTPKPKPDQTSAPEPDFTSYANPYEPSRYDEEGRAYNSQNQQLRWNEDGGGFSLVGAGEKRGGRIEAKRSTDTVDRALSLVRNVAKKDKK